MHANTGPNYVMYMWLCITSKKNHEGDVIDGNCTSIIYTRNEAAGLVNEYENCPLIIDQWRQILLVCPMEEDGVDVTMVCKCTISLDFCTPPLWVSRFLPHKKLYSPPTNRIPPKILHNPCSFSQPFYNCMLNKTCSTN